MKMNLNINAKLPSDIVKVIFSKVPFLNLLNCRIVCKTWNEVVLEYAASSSKFHLPPPKAFLFCTHDVVPYTKVFENAIMHCIDSDTNGYVATHRFGDWSYVSILSSCNGLLHIYKGAHHNPCQHGIWNPMTNQFLQLPDFGEPQYMFGFGCSLRTKEYKLFKILGIEDENDEGNDITEIEVLRFGIGNDLEEWDDFECRQPPFRIMNDGIYFDGVIYFIGINITYQYVIYGLDVETETFETVTILDVGPYSPTYCACTQPFNDTICATIIMPGKRQLWVMRAKHFWIREFVIDLPDYLELCLIKAFEDERKLSFRCKNNLFCVDKTGKMNKMKTLFNSKDTLIPCSLSIQSFNFGSLSKILAGNN